MPSEKQKTITIHLDIWERYEKIYGGRGEGYWRDMFNVRSVTGLIAMDLRKSIREREEIGG